VSPASCGIASLARQGLITPNPTTAYAARDNGHQSFLEGTVLNSAHKHVTPLRENIASHSHLGAITATAPSGSYITCPVNLTDVFVSIIASAHLNYYRSDCEA
jgi:hypothetical protein